MNKLIIALILIIPSLASAEIDLWGRIESYENKATIQSPHSVEDTVRIITENRVVCLSQSSGAGSAHLIPSTLTMKKDEYVILFTATPTWVMELRANDSGTEITLHSRFKTHMSKGSTHQYTLDSAKRWLSGNFTCGE